MGKRGSDLLKFIKEGLKKGIYPNLTKISEHPLIFKICFPRKTTKLDPAFEQFLKDWRALKRKPYKYSMAKQAVETALKKSDFFKKMAVITDGFVYQVLDDTEILKKKKSKSVKVKQEFHNPLSVESSGYGSGGDSGSFPISDEEIMEDQAPLTNEQFAIVPCREDSELVNTSCYYVLQDLNALAEPDFVCVDPNEIIIDERNKVWQPEDQSKEKVSDDCQNMDSLNPFYLQDAFCGVDFPGDPIDLDELMNIDLQGFEEDIKEEKPQMPMYQLKEVKNNEDGSVLIFSLSASGEGLKEDSIAEGESRISVDTKLMEKISAAVLCPLNIGFINGEIHLCLKH